MATTLQQQKVITVVIRLETGSDNSFKEIIFPEVDKELKTGYKIKTVYQSSGDNGKFAYTVLTFILEIGTL